MAREDLLLEVNGITKRFGGIVAVENVSFKVHEGEVISIIGPNGAGKTTVFNMLTGVYKVDEGTIKFKGEEIQSINPRDIVKRYFQNIPEHSPFLGYESNRKCTGWCTYQNKI